MQEFETVCVALAVWRGDTLENIKECLESLDAQVLLRFEVVIAIDGPIPNQVEEYLDSFDYQIIKIQFNKGLAASLNAIISNTDHQFIARMDADDICAPDRLSKQLEFMLNNKDVDVCGCAVESFGERKGVRKYPLTHQSCLKYFKFGDPISHPTAFFRRRFFEKVGLYDENLRKDQDTDLWARGFLQGAIFANLPSILLKFRVTKVQMGRRQNLNRIKAYMSLRFAINQRLKLGVFSYIYLILYVFSMFIPRQIKVILYGFLYR